jgi:hypothetical protein
MAFTVPLFDAFMKRAMPDFQPIQFIIADSFTDSLYQPNGNEDPNAPCYGPDSTT